MDEYSIFLQGYLNTNLVLIIPLVILGGFLTAFNPCCIPMYPAIFGFIGKICCTTNQCKQESREPENNPSPIFVALLFILGMAVTTTLMGALTISAGWIYGQIDIRLKFFLSVIPLLMGLYLLGYLPVKIPTFISHRLYINVNQQKKTVSTAFGAGILFTLIITPCATPILITILSFVALKNDLLYGSFLMFIYGVASGLPLLLIALGFKKIQQFTISNKWYLYLRKTSGLLLLGVGIYVISSLPWGNL